MQNIETFYVSHVESMLCNPTLGYELLHSFLVVSEGTCRFPRTFAQTGGKSLYLVGENWLLQWAGKQARGEKLLLGVIE